jgi:uncharacterized protein involved in exopolysaccharide biosynthesis
MSNSMKVLSTESAKDAESDLLGLFVLLWRHKWIVIVSALACAGIAVWQALTASVLYRAEVTITEVDNRQLGAAASLANQFGGLANLVGVNLGSVSSNGREAQTLLKSRRLVEEFITRNKLGSVLHPLPGKQPSLWMTVKSFRDDVLAIREDKRTGLTIVSITWKDPVLAAQWANQIVTLANELLRTHAISESQASIDYLNKRIATVNEVEVKRVMYGLIESETKTLMLANIKAEYALSVVDPAIAPEVRFSPRRTLMVAIGTLLGIVIGMMVVLGMQLLRTARVGQASAARVA